MINRIIEKVNNLSIKQQLIGIGLIILMTDLFIIFDVYILRQVFGFLCFTIISGFLMVAILRLDKLGFAEKFVLSVGLSVAFLMFVGLLINEVYYAFEYKTPLLTHSLMISFSLVMFGLLYCTYIRNKNKNFNIPEFDLKNKTGKLMFLIPLIFPILSVIGMYLMNTRDNNIILMFLYLLIPIYVILIAFLKDKVPEKVYPLAVLMISFSLASLGPLRGDYLITGGDVNLEYYAFQLTLNNNHWDIEPLRTGYNACLSVGILPAVYSSLLSIDIAIFKVCYILIFFLVPLIMYLTFKDKYLTKNYAFLSSCFFMFQCSFTVITYQSRVAIAMLFFALAFMILLNTREDELKKRILFMIFMMGVIFSHYSTAYITFILLSLTLLILSLQKQIYKKSFERKITLTFVILFFVVIFFWYSQLTDSSFNDLMGFAKNTFINLQYLFAEELKNEATMKILGETGILPEKISYFAHLMSFILIGIGVVTLIKKSNLKLNTYFSLIIVCSFILVLVETLPYLSKGYGMTRTYQLVIILLSPAFVIGCVTISKFLKQNSTMIIITFLILQFIAANLLFYQLAGIPYSMLYNSEGVQYDQGYVHHQDISMALWLKNSKEDSSSACFDWGRRYAHTAGLFREITYCFQNNKTTDEEYISLRYENVVNGKLQIMSYSEEYGVKEGRQKNNVTEYFHLFINKNKIYNSRGSEIYK